MDPCFDAVRWQGLGEMVRGLSPRQQAWLVGMLEATADMCPKKGVLRPILNTMAGIVREGIPDDTD